MSAAVSSCSQQPCGLVEHTRSPPIKRIYYSIKHRIRTGFFTVSRIKALTFFCAHDNIFIVSNSYGGVAQLARAFGSYPGGQVFESLRRYQSHRRHRISLMINMMSDIFLPAIRYDFHTENSPTLLISDHDSLLFYFLCRKAAVKAG